MKTLLPIATGALMLALAVPTDLEGQRYKGPHVSSHGRHGSGPSFCRSGRGHPVHGIRWCVDRGWYVVPVVVRPRRAHLSPWAVVDWRPVPLGRAAAWGPYPITGRELEDLVGRRTYRLIRDHARRDGLHGRLVAHPIGPRSGGPGLEVRSGGLPVARLIDYDRDGWAETALLWRGRRW